jgi:hypothetical protein
MTHFHSLSFPSDSNQQRLARVGTWILSSSSPFARKSSALALSDTRATQHGTRSSCSRRYETSFRIQLTILDWDKLSSTDYVGETGLKVSELLAEKLCCYWVPRAEWMGPEVCALVLLFAWILTVAFFVARRLLKSLSIKQGFKYDTPESALDIPTFSISTS